MSNFVTKSELSLYYQVRKLWNDVNREIKNDFQQTDDFRRLISVYCQNT